MNNDLHWTPNTKPDKPGIWFRKGYEHPLAIPEGNLGLNWPRDYWFYHGPLPDIKEPVQVREGGYYETRAGEIVGPATFLPGRSVLRWSLNGQSYKDDGCWNVEGKPTQHDLIREVPPPIKYREPTMADVGREIQVSDIDESYACDIRVQFIGMDGTRFVARELSGEYAAWKYARIIDDGKPVREAREWFISVDSESGNVCYYGDTRVHVREVVEE